MAQNPWQVLNDVSVTSEEASAIAARCARDYSRRSKVSEEWRDLVSNLSVFSQTIIERSNTLKPKNISSFTHNNLQSNSLNNLSKNEKIQPLTNEKSTFAQVTARGTVYLHPCFLQSIERGIRAFLSIFLFKYVPEFQGIWLAYHPKVTCLDSAGFVSEAEKFAIITFQIEVKCLIFRPYPGSVIIGTVTHIRPTHITLLVHGIFTVCIRQIDLEKRYTFTKKGYVCKDGVAATIRELSLVAVEVLRYHHTGSGDIMSIEGSLTDATSCGVIDPNTLNLLKEFNEGTSQPIKVKLEDVKPTVDPNLLKKVNVFSTTGDDKKVKIKRKRSSQLYNE